MGYCCQCIFFICFRVVFLGSPFHGDEGGHSLNLLSLQAISLIASIVIELSTRLWFPRGGVPEKIVFYKFFITVPNWPTQLAYLHGVAGLKN